MKKAIKFIIVILSLLILFILVLKQIELRDYKGKGDVMLEKISNYKKLNGELPNNSTDFFYSNEMGEGPYYEKINDSRFVVFFNIGFDNKLKFNSISEKWYYE